MLTTEEIRFILERLRETTVIEPGDVFPYRISARGSFGYSNDPKIGALQAKLSVMLEVAGKRTDDAAAVVDALYHPTRELAELRAAVIDALESILAANTDAHVVERLRALVR